MSTDTPAQSRRKTTMSGSGGRSGFSFGLFGGHADDDTLFNASSVQRPGDDFLPSTLIPALNEVSGFALHRDETLQQKSAKRNKLNGVGIDQSDVHGSSDTTQAERGGADDYYFGIGVGEDDEEVHDKRNCHTTSTRSGSGRSQRNTQHQNVTDAEELDEDDVIDDVAAGSLSGKAVGYVHLKTQVPAQPAKRIRAVFESPSASDDAASFSASKLDAMPKHASLFRNGTDAENEKSSFETPLDRKRPAVEFVTEDGTAARQRQLSSAFGTTSPEKPTTTEGAECLVRRSVEANQATPLSSSVVSFSYSLIFKHFTDIHDIRSENELGPGGEISKCRTHATCRYCQKRFRGNQGVSSNFIAHIRHEHPQAYRQYLTDYQQSGGRGRTPSLSSGLQRQQFDVSAFMSATHNNMVARQGNDSKAGVALPQAVLRTAASSTTSQLQRALSQLTAAAAAASAAGHAAELDNTVAVKREIGTAEAINVNYSKSFDAGCSATKSNLLLANTQNDNKYPGKLFGPSLVNHEYHHPCMKRPRTNILDAFEHIDEYVDENEKLKWRCSCRFCKSVLKTDANVTSNLYTHIKRCHPQQYQTFLALQQQQRNANETLVASHMPHISSSPSVADAVCTVKNSSLQQSNQVASTFMKSMAAAAAAAAVASSSSNNHSSHQSSPGEVVEGGAEAVDVNKYAGESLVVVRSRIIVNHYGTKAAKQTANSKVIYADNGEVFSSSSSSSNNSDIINGKSDSKQKGKNNSNTKADAEANDLSNVEFELDEQETEGEEEELHAIKQESYIFLPIPPATTELGSETLETFGLRRLRKILNEEAVCLNKDTWNSRGESRSATKTHYRIALDGITVVNRLMSLGFRSQNLCVCDKGDTYVWALVCGSGKI